MGIIIYYLSGDTETFTNIVKIKKEAYSILITFDDGSTKQILTNNIDVIEAYI